MPLFQSLLGVDLNSKCKKKIEVVKMVGFNFDHFQVQFIASSCIQNMVSLVYTAHLGWSNLISEQNQMFCGVFRAFLLDKKLKPTRVTSKNKF